MRFDSTNDAGTRGWDGERAPRAPRQGQFMENKNKSIEHNKYNMKSGKARGKPLNALAPLSIREHYDK